MFSYNKKIKVLNYMKARLQNFFIALVSLAAAFGVISGAILLFSPQKLTSIQSALTVTAQQKEAYHLPQGFSNKETVQPPVQADRCVDIFVEIADKARPAVVLIEAERKVAVRSGFPDEFFFFPFFPPGKRNGPEHEIERGAGSGFIIDLKNGYLVTNNHVVENADKIKVTTFDGKKHPAKVIGRSKKVDIAILKIEDFKPSVALKQLVFADSDGAKVGEWVLALGAPFELPQTATHGIISNLARSADTLGIMSAASFIQTDAAINPGNSGGPLVNKYGEVLGMNTAIYTKSGQSAGIGFAIPANTIRIVAEALINNGELKQPYLGIEMEDLSRFGPAALKELSVPAETEGVLVSRIVPDSPASRAGLQPYDIIQSLNGQDVKSPTQIAAKILFLKPKQEIKIQLLRNGKSITIKAILEEAPASLIREDSGNTEEQKSSPLAEKYGLSLSDTDPKGVVKISAIEPRSIAQRARLEVGDEILEVNRQKVTSIIDVENILKKIEKENEENKVLFLLVNRKGNKMAVIMQVG